VRILFEHFMYSSDDLEGISLFNTYKAIVEGCKRLQEPLIAYYAAPRETRSPDVKGRIDWSPKRMQDLGFTPLPVGTPYMPRTTYPYFQEEFVKLVRDKEFAIDAVWTCNYPHTASLQTLQHSLVSKWDVECPLPIINYFMETTLDADLFQMRYDEIAGSIAMSAACTPMAVMNLFDRIEIYRLARKYLSPAMVKKVQENSFVLPPGFDTETIDGNIGVYELERQARRDTGQINIFHGGANDKKRHISSLINAVKEVRKKGIDCHVYLTTQNKWKSEEDWVHIQENCVGDDYINSFGNGDLLWMASDYEGTGIGYMEAVRSGMIPLCNRNALWVKDRIPSSYPVWFDNPDNVGNIAVLLAGVIKKFDEIKDSHQRNLIDSMSPFSLKCVAGDFVYLTQKAIIPQVEKNEEIARSCFAFQFLQYAESKLVGRRVTPNEVYEAMTAETEKQMDFKWVGVRGLRYMLMSLGFKDTYEEELAFVKDD